MGLRDTAEQLDACKAQSVLDEQRIADLERALATQTTDLQIARDNLARVATRADERLADRDRQIAELEHDLARAESALADRLRHDAHAHPTAHRIDREPLFDAVAAHIDAILDEHDERIPNRATGSLVDAILALVQPADGILISPEQAALATRACRHSAHSIAAILDVDPSRLHPEIAPYIDRLTDLADYLQARA